MIRGMPAMPNDAKLGLVVGVGLTIAIAVVFFSKDSASSDPSRTAHLHHSAQALASDRSGSLAVPGQTGGRSNLSGNASTITHRTHVIAAGDTLFTIAQRYYGRGDRFAEIYQANQRLLTNPDRLPIGQSIIIP